MAVAALAAALCGCAAETGRGLVPGQSTESQVEALMGPSADRRQKPAGESVRYYSRLPQGREMYAARFGADGKLISIEQRLMEREVWAYPMKGSPFPKLLHVEFTPDKVLREIFIHDDTLDPI